MTVASLVVALKSVRIAFAVMAMLGASIAASAQEMVSVAGKDTNMRAGPGTDHAVSWILAIGYPLMVIERRDGWLKVQDFENDVGWILQSLTKSVPYHIVKARVANLRAKPSEQSRVLGQAPRGEILKTLEKRPSWVQVQRENGVRGWIARQLLWGW